MMLLQWWREGKKTTNDTIIIHYQWVILLFSMAESLKIAAF
jgi:hypothetical protein